MALFGGYLFLFLFKECVRFNINFKTSPCLHFSIAICSFKFSQLVCGFSFFSLHFLAFGSPSLTQQVRPSKPWPLCNLTFSIVNTPPVLFVS